MQPAQSAARNSRSASAWIPLQFSNTDLRELLRSTLEPLRHEAERLDVELQLAVEPRLPREVTLDRDKIAWSVATLVGNALRYVRHGTSRMPGGVIRVELGCDESARELSIIVRDDGRGIPEAKLRALFERTGECPHAAGLGLKLIRDIVEAHGGELAIESRDSGVQRGTSVSLRLPVVAGDQF